VLEGRHRASTLRDTEEQCHVPLMLTWTIESHSRMFAKNLRVLHGIQQHCTSSRGNCWHTVVPHDAGRGCDA